MQRRLPKADAEEILSLAPEPDLIEQMPRLFAADLRAALGGKARHERVVLLFDTHEAFFGEAIADPQALLHADLLMRDKKRRWPGQASLSVAGSLAWDGPRWSSWPRPACHGQFV